MNDNKLLVINGTDITGLIEEGGYSPANEDLHSDTSGRDTNTGDMYLKVINNKYHLTVNFIELYESEAAVIANTTRGNGSVNTFTFRVPSVKSPVINTQMYCSKFAPEYIVFVPGGDSILGKMSLTFIEM